MRTSSVKHIQDRWILESKESDLGLWWLAQDLRGHLGKNAEEKEVRTRTLEALQPLLTTGLLKAVDLLPEGKYSEWQGSIEQQLKRIEKEWVALNRPPKLGDIVWFIGPRA
jgi:hypothetical protein